jgi:hypothetical protein
VPPEAPLSHHPIRGLVQSSLSVDLADGVPRHLHPPLADGAPRQLHPPLADSAHRYLPAGAPRHLPPPSAGSAPRCLHLPPLADGAPRHLHHPPGQCLHLLVMAPMPICLRLLVMAPMPICLPTMPTAIAIRPSPPLRPRCRSCGCRLEATRRGSGTRWSGRRRHRLETARRNALASASEVRGPSCHNCVESGCPLTSKVFFWTPSPNERLPPYPGLLIPPLPAPERYDLSHHLVVRPRSAHAARC